VARQLGKGGGGLCKKKKMICPENKRRMVGETLQWWGKKKHAVG